MPGKRPAPPRCYLDADGIQSRDFILRQRQFGGRQQVLKLRHRVRADNRRHDRPARPRVIGIYGGKLTGWRATAEHVMKRIAGSLPHRKPRANTRTLRIAPE